MATPRSAGTGRRAQPGHPGRFSSLRGCLDDALDRAVRYVHDRGTFTRMRGPLYPPQIGGSRPNAVHDLVGAPAPRVTALGCAVRCVVEELGAPPQHHVVAADPSMLPMYTWSVSPAPAPAPSGPVGAHVEYELAPRRSTTSSPPTRRCCRCRPGRSPGPSWICPGCRWRPGRYRWRPGAAARRRRPRRRCCRCRPGRCPAPAPASSVSRWPPGRDTRWRPGAAPRRRRPRRRCCRCRPGRCPGPSPASIGVPLAPRSRYQVAPRRSSTSSPPTPSMLPM